MRDAKVGFSARALRQLDDLRDYIASASSPSIADSYVAKIFAQCQRLAVFPERGTKRSDLAPGVRSISHDRRCQILFTVEDGDVVIAGVFYGGQDIGAAFASD